MPMLPIYAVVIHVAMNAFSKGLINEIESIAKDYELDELSDSESGIRNYLWAFETWEDAVAAGEKFMHLSPNPNLLMLRVTSFYDATKKAISHKDLVRPKNKA